jgi:hypothetical protein
MQYCSQVDTHRIEYKNQKHSISGPMRQQSLARAESIHKAVKVLHRAEYKSSQGCQGCHRVEYLKEKRWNYIVLILLIPPPGHQGLWHLSDKSWRSGEQSLERRDAAGNDIIQYFVVAVSTCSYPQVECWLEPISHTLAIGITVWLGTSA